LYPGQGDEVPQAPWAEGAIGTAKHLGISLKKVIKDCGGLINGAKHLEFYGAETYFKADQVMNYLVSVPWSKVKANEVMLAWEWMASLCPRSMVIHWEWSCWDTLVLAALNGFTGSRLLKTHHLHLSKARNIFTSINKSENTISVQQMGFRSKR
jgi:hypothetical protein